MGEVYDARHIPQIPMAQADMARLRRRASGYPLIVTRREPRADDALLGQDRLICTDGVATAFRT